MTKFQKLCEKLKLKRALEKQEGQLAPVTLPLAGRSPCTDSLHSRPPKSGSAPK